MKKTLPFEREKHLYRRDDFEEICKDAMRFFSGTGVSCIGDIAESSPYAAVYAIYSTATSGLYEKFGKRINRVEFCKPVYVGFSSGGSQRWECTSSFIDLSLARQLAFWKSKIDKTPCLTFSDFHYRAMLTSSFVEAFCVRQRLVEKYRPIWNKHFALAALKKDISREWKAMHTEKKHLTRNSVRLSRRFEKDLRVVS